jgi:septum site-determining protein MinC
LSNAKDASGIIYELSSILEMPEAQSKKICLKLGKIDLSQSQLLSIKSLITSMESTLDVLDTTSQKTELTALDCGMNVSRFVNEIKIQELEDSEEAEIKEMEVGEPKDGLSYELLENPDSQIEKPLETFDFTELMAPVKEEIQTEDTKEPTKEHEIIQETQIEELSEEDVLLKEEQKVAALDEISKLPTLYLQQNLRSGQTMSYDGNIVLIGDAKPGSEIIAKGDITVWGVLGGIAHAGARGNDYAKIRALKIHAIQLRVSGFYARRPDSVNIPFIQRTDSFTPEEARVNNNEIAIYKLSEA